MLSSSLGAPDSPDVSEQDDSASPSSWWYSEVSDTTNGARPTDYISQKIVEASTDLDGRLILLKELLNDFQCVCRSIKRDHYVNS